MLCDGNGCLLCEDTFVVQSGSCICPNGTNLDSSGKCSTCSSALTGCVTCSNPTVCSECRVSYALSNGECTCDGGKIEVNLECVSCDSLWGSGCVACGERSCNQCNNSLVLKAGNGQWCWLCNDAYPNCLTCNDTHCLECETNYALIDSACLCLSPTHYLSSSNCHSCLDTFSCPTCNSTHCLTCPSLFTL